VSTSDRYEAFGSGGRLQACIHLSADANTGVLLDCGATSLVAPARQGIDPNTIATVFVSHMHVDLVEHRTQIASARTILTHVSTDMLARAAAAEFELAHDGLTINL
jgi:metal-dependent hydrolase (beta-lactamase superfamily II)